MIPFWLENDEYVGLEIDWVDSFEMAEDINFDNKNIPINGTYICWDKSENLFYKTEGLIMWKLLGIKISRY